MRIRSKIHKAKQVFKFLDIISDDVVQWDNKTDIMSDEFRKQTEDILANAITRQSSTRR
ncbi:hypothetical protein PBCVNEJV4_092R [Paramecium bursaria Chlorella virus NE-JV-4]|nr:hypothetical protein PBCVNEJV4_092R [Paramecium bursaria Chlorella virus NE-JV-4]